MELGLDAVYLDGADDLGVPCSSVSAEVFEMMLRELHNAIAMSGIDPTNDDLTQLYQAITNIDMRWSKDIDYRNPTLILSSDNVLYTLIKPSGPHIVLPNNSTVGPKEPTVSPEYWERFFISKDTNIIALADEVSKLTVKLDILEPQVTSAVLSALQPLLDMHTNNSIATNTNLGHAKPGKGITINIQGELSALIDNHTIELTEDNKISVNGPNVKPAFANYSNSGIVIIGEGLKTVNDSLIVNNHESESSKFGKGSFQDYGHIKLTDDYQSNTDATAGIGASPKALQTMKDDVLGSVSETVITSSRAYEVATTAQYTITIVGGGGNGGQNGARDSDSCCTGTRDNGSCYSYAYANATGGAGGGGGAGETITTTVTLTKGTSVQVTIGGSGGGTTSFGTYATARGGGNGGNGTAGYAYITGSFCTDITERNGNNGKVGVSYGTPASGTTGGRSIQGTYGHGGNAASAGTQGVCIISLKLGG